MMRIGPNVIVAAALWSLCLSGSAQPAANPSRFPPADTLLRISPEYPQEYRQQMDEMRARLDQLGWSLGEVSQSLRDDMAALTENAETHADIVQTRLGELEEKESQLRRQVNKISKDQRGLADSLRRDIDTLRRQDADLQGQQETLVDSLRELSRSTGEELADIGHSLFLHRLLIGLLILIAAAAFIAVILIIPRDRENKALTEEKLTLNARILTLLDQQLQIMNLMGLEPAGAEQAINHALGVRVGIEIFRMRNGLERIDPEVKGINALKHALSLLEEEFLRQGYTIRDLTGEPYPKDSNIKIKKSNVMEDVPPGSPLIERVVTPQILYKGEIVHPGEVEIAISAKDQ